MFPPADLDLSFLNSMGGSDSLRKQINKSMIQFKEYAFLAEGGKRVQGLLGAKAIRIPRPAVESMMKDVISKLSQNSPLTSKDFSGIGSVEPETFKRTEQTKQDFGDLDIAVDVTPLKVTMADSLEIIKNLVHKKLGVSLDQINANKGLIVVSFPYPIPGYEGFFGQVDLMPTSDLKFTTDFAYTVRSKAGEIYSRDKYAQSALSIICQQLGKRFSTKGGDPISPEQTNDYNEFYETRFFFKVQTGLNIGKRLHKWKKNRDAGTSTETYTLLADPIANPYLITTILFGPYADDPAATRSIDAMVEQLQKDSTQHATFDSLYRNWHKIQVSKNPVDLLQFEDYDPSIVEKVNANLP